MKKKAHFFLNAVREIRVILFLFVMLLSGINLFSQDENVMILTMLGALPKDLSEADIEFFKNSKEIPDIESYDIIEINTLKLLRPDGKITLQLPNESESYTFTEKSIEYKNVYNYYWYGEDINSMGNNATFSVSEGRLYGDIMWNDKFYMIYPISSKYSLLVTPKLVTAGLCGNSYQNTENTSENLQNDCPPSLNRNQGCFTSDIASNPCGNANDIIFGLFNTETCNPTELFIGVPIELVTCSGIHHYDFAYSLNGLDYTTVCNHSTFPYCNFKFIPYLATGKIVSVRVTLYASGNDIHSYIKDFTPPCPLPPDIDLSSRVRKELEDSTKIVIPPTQKIKVYDILGRIRYEGTWVEFERNRNDYIGLNIITYLNEGSEIMKVNKIFY